MLKKIREIIPDTHPLRLFYHKVKSVIAAYLYRFPAKKLTVIGVTGTNGKTSTVNLITQMLEKCGHKVGMTSTINFKIVDELIVNTSKQTTMSPFLLQKMLRCMVKKGCKYAVLEVSSHAITQSRIWGVKIDVAVMTNVTQDHLEYHGGFDEYIKAKGGLFAMAEKAIVLNKDCQHYDYFAKFKAEQNLSYGLKGGDVRVEDVEKTPEGSKFLLKTRGGTVKIAIKLPGDYNLYNCLAAGTCGLALGFSLEEVKKGLEACESIPGRYELVDKGQNFTIVVDYAHAEDSLESLLTMYKELAEGRVIAVFGATGGGRDKLKRPKMGKVADRLADVIILTDDDPYEEDEMEIIEQVAEGISREEGNDFKKIPDRREAIFQGLSVAREGDCVVVAGKGCEEVMMLHGEKIEWNDRAVIEEILEKLNA
jgi:UDP-N-acetylmuramoyl-L-alanyl-D-glutamate--2,6-diaminopimelate ligase